MKYIKAFEAKAKVGQKVICIDSNNANYALIENNVYTIEMIRNNNTPSRGGYVQYKLSGVLYWWDDIRFKIGTKKEIEEIEMNQNVKKYNL